MFCPSDADLEPNPACTSTQSRMDKEPMPAKSWHVCTCYNLPGPHLTRPTWTRIWCTQTVLVSLAKTLCGSPVSNTWCDQPLAYTPRTQIFLSESHVDPMPALTEPQTIHCKKVVHRLVICVVRAYTYMTRVLVQLHNRLDADIWHIEMHGVLIFMLLYSWALFRALILQSL